MSGKAAASSSQVPSQSQRGPGSERATMSASDAVSSARLAGKYACPVPPAAAMAFRSACTLAPTPKPMT